MNPPLKRPLQFFYGTAPQPCPYLPGRVETKVVTELAGPDADEVHHVLSQAGFRRSHGIAYRPTCPGCNACVPVRIVVRDFRESRSLRRVRRANADLSALEMPPIASLEQYALFTAYEQMAKASHAFNLLDARGAIGVTERQRYILRVRTLAQQVAGAYYASRESLGFPLCDAAAPAGAQA